MAPLSKFLKNLNRSIVVVLILSGIFLTLGIFLLTKNARRSQNSPATQTTSSSTAATSSAPSPIQPLSNPNTQFVVLSFDGSKSLDMWEETRAFAREMAAQQKPIHFTYFISGVYFLAPQFATTYHPPGLPPGTTKIGFADSVPDIIARVKEINSAMTEGHEIASHLNGHFDGTPWTEDEWQQEFSEFNKLVFNWKENNQAGANSTATNSASTASDSAILATAEPLNLQPDQIKGFRAPLLGRNQGMYQVLKKMNFSYDSSGIAASPTTWPTQNAFGTWLIPLSAIPVAGTRASVLSMDYNWYYLQSRGRDLARRNSPLWKRYHDQVYNSYMNYFMQNYHGSHAPVIIGHHFSLWNDGVYWEAMKDFARQVCGLPDVKCVTFGELTKNLEARKQ